MIVRVNRSPVYDVTYEAGSTNSIGSDRERRMVIPPDALRVMTLS
jgi:hypothetical protein